MAVLWFGQLYVSWLLATAGAFAVGISLGLLGGGGSILAVPILVYVLGLGAKNAIAISLISVGMVSLIGTFLHWQKGNVRLDIAFVFAPAAMLGAYLGALLAGLPWISEGFQLLCFSVIMLIASCLMIVKSRAKFSTTQVPTINTPHPGRLKRVGTASPTGNRSLLHKITIPAEGLGIGILTGFVGVGGGFIIVPALVLLTNIPMKQAVGTSLLIISLKSVTGFLGYMGQTEFNWLLAGSFTLAACLGTLLGSYLNKFINARALQAGFGYFVLSFAVLMLMAQFIPEFSF
ncbi:MAG: sulfite exporter TauE/SafE family protein [Cyanobacteria bacterium P01_F01_bin.53]